MRSCSSGQVALGVEVEGGAALDARDRSEAALARDLSRLRRPGRDGAEARRHQLQRAGGFLACRMRPEQVLQPRQVGRRQRRVQLDEIPVLGGQSLQPGQGGLDVPGEAGKAVGGEGGGAAQLEDFGHDGNEPGKAQLYPLTPGTAPDGTMRLPLPRELRKISACSRANPT